jgi:hypothetical protein
MVELVGGGPPLTPLRVRVRLQTIEKVAVLIYIRKNLPLRINNISLNGGALRVVEGRHFPQHPSTFPLLSLSLSNSNRIHGLLAFWNYPSPTLNALLVRDNMLITKAKHGKNACPHRTLRGSVVGNRVEGIMKVVKKQVFFEAAGTVMPKVATVGVKSASVVGKMASVGSRAELRSA